jgi:MFS family permease
MTRSHSVPTPGGKLATRIAFFLAGMGISCWAPLVPYAKTQIGLNEADLGLLLLYLGIGSVIAMPIAGGMAVKFGSRRVIIIAAIGIITVLPLLAIAPSPLHLAAALAVFGASLGAIDVAANIHGTEVEHREGVPLMSNFHGFYSIGGLAGSGVMTLLLTRQVTPFAATICASLFGLGCILIAAPRLLAAQPDHQAPFFVRPHGIVLVIGILTFALFLVEGAILDWGAVLLHENRGMPRSEAGTGYVLFSLAMTCGRLTGDRVTAKWGGSRVLFHGAWITAAGLAGIVYAPGTILALAGFLIVGIGAANLVPVLYSAAGRQTVMPKDLAISAISIMGYSGILIGPAAIGFFAKLTSLPATFGGLALMTLGVAALAGKATGRAGR